MDIAVFTTTPSENGVSFSLEFGATPRFVTGRDELIQRVVIELYSDSSALVDGSEFVSGLGGSGTSTTAEARATALAGIARARSNLLANQSNGVDTFEAEARLRDLRLEDFTKSGDEWSARIRIVPEVGESFVVGVAP